MVRVIAASSLWPVVKFRHAVPAVLLALVTSACSPQPAAPRADEPVEEPEPQPRPQDDPEPDTERPKPAPPSCRSDRLERESVVALTGEDVHAAAIEVARRTHRCATTVVVAASDGGWSALLAVPVALAEDAPLLLADPADPSQLLEVLDLLKVEEVISVGMPGDGLGRPGTALVTADREGSDEVVADAAEPAGATDAAEPAGGATDAAGPRAGSGDSGADTLDPEVELALIVARHLGVRRFLAVPAGDRRARAAAASRTDGSRALLPVPDATPSLSLLAESLPTGTRIEVLASRPDTAVSLADQLLAVGIDAEAGDGSMWADAEPTSWLVDPRQTAAAAVAAVAAGGRGDAVLPVDGSDLRVGRDDTSRLSDADVDRAVLVGDVTPHASWQLPLVLEGPALPGGGFKLFERQRLVALYGHPGNSQLGALGEQGLEATIERLRTVAEPYAADGLAVQPALEIITTVATSEGGQEGDFSRRTDPGVLWPWVDRAADEQLYVLLDLQPGHTDFLDQAREYEELLREPHVGLALDPEWRLEEDQRHLDQIGSVGVDEVQRVADWLAQLTRDAGLPEKLLVLHQFRVSMLPDRDALDVPPELAVVVHMDGQGPLPTKFDSYARITAGAEDRWIWGWKNFFDEDDPMATPEQVLGLDPVPLLVTYQ